MGFYKHTVAGEELWLLPQKAVHWPKEKALLIADVHLGKATHFRKHGIPVTNKVIEKDLDNLNNLFNLYDIKHVIVLGDFFHSDQNSECEIFRKWRVNFKEIKFSLIKGNHDILPYYVYEEMGIETHKNYLRVGPFTLQHFPTSIDDFYNEYIISGHIHPAVEISGKANQYVKVECFWFGKTNAILPAFGNFTGNEIITRPEKELFLITPGNVIPCCGKV